MTGPLLALALGAACGTGLLVLFSSVAGRVHRASGREALRVLLALAAGGAVAGLTGWVALVPIVAVGLWGLPRLLGQTRADASIEKIEAVATWTEMLQSTLAASSGLYEAIVATAPLSPLPIRDAAQNLAARILANEHPRDALLAFANDVDEPSADGVVCALLLIVTSRAHRITDLLEALAAHARADADMRLRVETSRASVRSSIRTVVVFSVLFAAGLAVVARSYLAPYASATGQYVLLLVGAVYAVALVAMVALSRPAPPVRLLGKDVRVA